jgi:hypothetical protein
VRVEILPGVARRLVHFVICADQLTPAIMLVLYGLGHCVAEEVLQRLVHIQGRVDDSFVGAALARANDAGLFEFLVVF